MTWEESRKILASSNACNQGWQVLYDAIDAALSRVAEIERQKSDLLVACHEALCIDFGGDPNEYLRQKALIRAAIAKAEGK